MSEPPSQLPQEVGERILSMLKPQPPPHCVLIFENENHGIVYKKDTITEAEHNFITRDARPRFAGDVVYAHPLPDFPGLTVFAALLSGFRFQDEASRARWKNGEDFEMYRDITYRV
jgi:hypothetical protein